MSFRLNIVCSANGYAVQQYYSIACAVFIARILALVCALTSITLTCTQRMLHCTLHAMFKRKVNLQYQKVHKQDHNQAGMTIKSRATSFQVVTDFRDVIVIPA